MKAREVRHVARWYGKTGGITSLAAHGLCGPDAGNSRIGARASPRRSPALSISLSAVRRRATFEAAKQQ